MSLEQTEDLKAFERRMTEVIAHMKPRANLWRVVLLVMSVITSALAWNWLWDPETSKVALMISLCNHPAFAIFSLGFLVLFVGGIHKRVVAPSIIASRCKQVLSDYNMSCDDTGKLILKPRPT